MSKYRVQLESSLEVEVEAETEDDAADAAIDKVLYDGNSDWWVVGIEECEE